jgi:RHS repeat-associated protein
VIDALGAVTHYRYQRINRRDRVVTMTHADGAVERFAFDPLGRLIAHHDPQGHATRYRLDPAGRPTLRENALGHTLGYQYDVHGRLATLTNENGAIYRFGWDVADRLICEQGFDARRIDYRYNAAGELVESLDGVPHGAEWMASLPGVLRSVFVRDAMGRLLEKTAARPAENGGSRTTRARYAYSRTGLLLQARNAQARVELAYTPTGRLAHETTHARDGRSLRISHRYDGLGNRIETVLPDGRVLKPELYGSGHVSKLKLDGEVITEFERDALHRETVRTQGQLRSFFERDAAGRLIRQFVKPQNNNAPTPEPKIARQYHYDRSGQLLQIDDARTGRSLYRYDATGRLLAAQGPLGTERFAFDPASNLIDPSQPQAQAPGAKKTWTESEWADYVREHLGDPSFNPLLTPEQRAQDPSQWGEAKPNHLLVYGEHRYRYDRWGNTVDKRSGGHRRMQLHWDAEHQLRVIAIERGEGINRSDAQTTSHTTAARLEHWAYDYDPFGRRISKYPVDATAANAWINQGDEAALAHALKAAINVARPAASSHSTTPGTALLTAGSRPATPSNPRRSDLDPTPAPRPLSAHPTRANAKAPPAPTLFCWDGNRLLAETRADTHQLYLYEPDSFVPLAIVRTIAANEPADTSDTRDSSATRSPDRTGSDDTLLPPELLSLKERYPEQWAKIEAQRRKLARQLGQSTDPEPKPRPKAEVFHLHVDHLGTPREITDEAGHLVWTAHYAAWGQAVTTTPPRRILGRQGNVVTEVIEEQAHPLECNLRFQGQYADAESGLHYNRFRYYQPKVGRFASQDPMGLPGGFNIYLYAANPTEFVDPWGMQPQAFQISGSTLCIKNKFAAGSAAALELEDFGNRWNSQIAGHGGSMTRRRLTVDEQRESDNWRARTWCKCPNGTVAGHIPDAAAGGPAVPADWMPQLPETNRYLAGIVRNIPVGTTYDSVKIVSNLSGC